MTKKPAGPEAEQALPWEIHDHNNDLDIYPISGTFSYLFFLLSQCEVLVMGKTLFGWAPSVSGCAFTPSPHPGCSWDQRAVLGIGKAANTCTATGSSRS